MSAGLPNASNNNQQILNDIQSLQNVEQNLFKNLETNAKISPEKQKEIINEINKISSMRINLYESLGDINNFFRSALNNSQGTLREQTAAIRIVEDELNGAKARLSALEDEKNNKIRLVQINTYYSDKYTEQTRLMKILILTLIPMVIVTFLYKKGILPNPIFYALVVIISIIGGWFLVKTWLSIISRDNMNYREYAWAFNGETAPTASGGEDTSDPWEVSMGTCLGEACCSDEQTYDYELNKCVTSSSVEQFTGYANVKPSVYLGELTPYESQSLINI